MFCKKLGRATACFLLLASVSVCGVNRVEAAGQPDARRMDTRAGAVKDAASEAGSECEGDVIGIGMVCQEGAQASAGVSALYSIGENGNIVGEGVRLRKLPKKTATILELMSNKETVCINYTKSASESNGNWYYVKRVRTGTWGWVNHQYLCHWD